MNWLPDSIRSAPSLITFIIIVVTEVTIASSLLLLNLRSTSTQSLLHMNRFTSGTSVLLYFECYLEFPSLAIITIIATSPSVASAQSISFDKPEVLHEPQCTILHV
jgi:hypothetical protein